MFAALVGFAVWFVRGHRRQEPAGAPVAASVPPAPERGEATGEPASVRDRESRPTTVFAAAATGHVLALRDLLDANPHASRVGQLDADGWTALHHAVYNDQLPCVRLLLERNADANAQAEHECTPLHMAAAQGSAAVVEALLGAGADPDPLDDAGATPLHYAARPGRLDVVSALLAGGALPTVKDVHLETALDLAARLEDPAVAEALEAAGGRRGADVRMADVLGELPEGHPARGRAPRSLLLPHEDEVVQEAVRKARKALPRLLVHLADHPEARAAVKFPLRAEGTVEHVWGAIVEPGHPLLVQLVADPVAVPAPEGDIEVPYDEVVDWQVPLPDGKTAGGYGERALYEAVRAEFGFLPEAAGTGLARLVDLPPPGSASGPSTTSEEPT